MGRSRRLRNAMAGANYRVTRRGTRDPSGFDRFMKRLTVFASKLSKQLGVTIFSSLLGVSREWVLTLSDSTISKRLEDNLGRPQTEDSKSLYSRGQNSYQNDYDYNRYNSKYSGAQSNGTDTFPGF